MFYGYMGHKDYPVWLEKAVQKPVLLIELSSICNFKCKYCTSEKSKRPKGQMDPELFYRIVDQINTSLFPTGIGLHVDGEPTIHPKFYEFAQAIIDKGVPLTCATNGSRMEPNLLDLEMKFMITISTNSEEFSLRSSMNFHKYIDRIINYLKVWNETGAKQTLFLRVPIVDSDVRDGLVDKKINFLLDLYKKAGLNGTKLDKEEVCFLTATNKAGYSLTAEKLFIVSDGIFTIMPGNEQRAVEHTDLSNGFCDIVWKMMVIYWDGSVGFCCHDIEGKNIYADKNDIFEKRLDDVWLKHSKIKQIRQNFLDGKVQLPLCRQCLKIYPTREFYANHPIDFCPDVFLESGETVKFSELGKRDRLCRVGFAKQGSQSQYHWTVSKVASLGFKLSEANMDEDLNLEVEYVSFAPKEMGDDQHFTVYLNSCKLMNVSMNGTQLKQVSIPMSKSCLLSENIVSFKFKERKSPYELGLSPDRRKLGIGISKISVK